MEAAIPPDTAAAADEGSSLAGSECTGCCCRLWLCSCCPAGVLLCGGLLSTPAAGAGPFVRANRGAAGATEACSAGRSATCSRACSCDSDCRPVRCPLNTCKFASLSRRGLPAQGCLHRCHELPQGLVCRRRPWQGVQGKVGAPQRHKTGISPKVYQGHGRLSETVWEKDTRQLWRKPCSVVRQDPQLDRLRFPGQPCSQKPGLRNTLHRQQCLVQLVAALEARGVIGKGPDA